MIDWFGARRRRAAASLRRALERGAPLPSLDGVSPSVATSLLLLEARSLELDDDPRALELGRLACRLSPRSAEAWSLVSRAAAPREAEQALEVLTALEPKNPVWLARHVDRLVEDNRAAEALRRIAASPLRAEPDLLFAKARALYALGKVGSAQEILNELIRYLEGELRGSFSSQNDGLRTLHEKVDRLRGEVLAETRGHEHLVIDAARRGRLDPRAAVNFKLLGQSLMAQAKRGPADTLTPPRREAERGKELLARDADDPLGLVLTGSAALRTRDLPAARRAFDHASREDSRSFAAMLGLAAAKAEEEHGLFALVRALPRVAEPEGLHEVVPELHALTPEERRVVALSASPFARQLPLLSEAGALIRIVPLHVRATDLPEFAELARERHSDHRSYHAMAGFAADGLAAARVEDLLDVRPEGLTFAHELAHLVHPFLSPEVREQIVELHEEACEVGFAVTEYALENEHEFFACSYTDWLCAEHELGESVPDPSGVRERFARLMDRAAGLYVRRVN